MAFIRKSEVGEQGSRGAKEVNKNGYGLLTNDYGLLTIDKFNLSLQIYVEKLPTSAKNKNEDS
ncbi:hypothetical protein [Nostoc parmelioides]|uniref:Uncharacterized protein n=1 Tax=Nostoc parmelioides FACHB-3921 TaxID=2692909 RepID=A0ABR8BCY6_9NOSO|nr:hypothetical protein [Nostoc parmelioides]MBD2251589.1 hypothetical protein [Nostoc parmelioides FACHB-3921]